VALLAAALVSLRWAAGRGYLRAAEHTRLRALGLRILRGLPLYLYAMPMPLAATWFAGQRAIAITPTNYWVALGLWLGAITLFVALLLPWVARRPRPNPGWHRSLPWLEIAAVTLLVLSAFAARVVDLANEPSPFSGDEANSALGALAVYRGELHNMFTTVVPLSQPAMYSFVTAPFYRVFGVGVLAHRLPSALFGTATVLLLYLFLRQFFDRRLALSGAAILVALNLHLHFSRVGMNGASSPFIAMLALYFTARALRFQKPLDFGLAGGAAGLCLYSYIGTRIVPLVVAGTVGVAVLRDRRFLRDNLTNLVVLVVGFLVVAGPQAIYFLEHQNQFMDSMRFANIFSSGWLEKEAQARNESQVSILLDQARLGFGTLTNYPETFPAYNSQQPLIDAFSRVPFVIGGVYALILVWKPRYFAIMALLLAAVVGGGVLSVPHPSGNRYITGTPAMAAVIALGMVVVADTAVLLWPRLRPLTGPAIAAMTALIVFVNLQFYFGDYIHTKQYSSDTTRNNDALGRYLADLGPDYVAYLYGGPFSAQEPSVRFRASDEILVDVPQGTTKLPQLEVSKPHAVFVAAPEREPELSAVVRACPGGVWQRFPNADQPSYVAYEVRDAQLCLPHSGSS
jgi:4-amino-4-deoxy-L-arabinose transferase-like glycosyltransferase